MASRASPLNPYAKEFVPLAAGKGSHKHLAVGPSTHTFDTADACLLDKLPDEVSQSAGSVASLCLPLHTAPSIPDVMLLPAGGSDGAVLPQQTP